jgi:hypothetical protein
MNASLGERRLISKPYTCRRNLALAIAPIPAIYSRTLGRQCPRRKARGDPWVVS